MNTKNQREFEKIYKETYQSVLKYVLCKCQNLDDVNELIQESYIGLYKILRRKHFIHIKDNTAYMIGITKNIMKKYYKNRYKNSNIHNLSNDIEEVELNLISNINLETDIITKENVSEIWNYLNEKNTLIAKIFYLYYSEGLKISEIAEMLSVNESIIKNYIYRTLKELREKFYKGGSLYEK